MLHELRSGVLVFWTALLAATSSEAGVVEAADFLVQETYAVHAMIGPGLGSSIGIFKVDKNGLLNGYALLNLPSNDGRSRRLVRHWLGQNTAVRSRMGRLHRRLQKTS
jgi:hypothetical protein